MKTILLVIALVAKADAPKAGLQEAAVAPAAVASEAVLPTGSFVKPSEPVAGEVCDATPSETAQMAVAAVEVSSAFKTTTARVNAPAFGAALLSEAGETTEPTVLEDIKVVKEALAQPARILPESRADSSCNLADLYRRRFLSGPWSVTRRLEAARMRGDTEEEQRLTAMLEEAVDEALEVEGTEP